MIRLPSSRISLTEADVNHHLQRIFLNRTLLSVGIQQDDIDSRRHRELYLRRDGLPPLKTASIPSPLSWSSSSTCSLDPLPSADVEDEAEPSHSVYDFSIYAPGCQDIVANTVQLVGSEPDPDPYGYGMDTVNDGRITARRRVERIPWPSSKAQVPGPSQQGKERVSLLTQNEGLEALDRQSSEVSLPNTEVSSAPRSSNPSAGKRHANRTRNPKTVLLADFRSSTLGNQLDEPVAGFPSQQVPIYRHAAVRKSSLLRFAQNAISEQITDEMIDDEVGTDGAQGRNGVSHHRRESTGDHRHGNHPSKPSDVNSGTLNSTDNYLSSCIPNLSIFDDRSSPSGFFPEIPPRAASATMGTDQQKSPKNTDSSRQDPSSLRVGSYVLESSSPPSSMPMYFPTSYVRTRLPGDPDAEPEEDQEPEEAPVETPKAAGMAVQHTPNAVPEDTSSGEGSNGSGQSSHTLSFPSTSDLSIEEQVLGPIIDRQFSVRPSIFAPSEMDVEMRRRTETDPAESAIRQRLANAIDAFRTEEASVVDTSDTESEAPSDGEDTDEQVGNSAQANGLRAEAQASSAINTGQATAGGQFHDHLSRTGVPTLPPVNRGQPATPNYHRRLPPPFPTPLQPNGSGQIQRGIQVYDDRRPATVQRPAAPSAHSHPQFAPGHCPHTAPRAHRVCYWNSSHRSHDRPIDNASPTRTTTGDQPVAPVLSLPRPNEVSSNNQNTGTTGSAQGNVNHTGTVNPTGVTNPSRATNTTRPANGQTRVISDAVIARTTTANNSSSAYDATFLQRSFDNQPRDSSRGDQDAEAIGPSGGRRV